MLPRVDHQGSTYEFTRLPDGEGRWVCVKGSCIGTVHSNGKRDGKNVIVPVMFDFMLSNIAVENGVNRADLRRYIIKPERVS